MESFGPQGVLKARRRHRQEHVCSEMGGDRECLAAQSVEAMAASMASDQRAQGPEADQADLFGKLQQLPDCLLPEVRRLAGEGL